MTIPFNALAEECQRRLVARGHDLGTSGPRGNGVDGALLIDRDARLRGGGHQSDGGTGSHYDDLDDDIPF